jgi:adenylate kinase
LAETPTEKFPVREFPPTNEKETQEIEEIVEEETVTKTHTVQKSVPDFPEGVPHFFCERINISSFNLIQNSM